MEREFLQLCIPETINSMCLQFFIVCEFLFFEQFTFIEGEIEAQN